MRITESRLREIIRSVIAEDFDYYADEIEQQPEVEQPKEEKSGQKFKAGQMVQVFNLKMYNDQNNDKPLKDSVGDAWENAGIFLTNDVMDVEVVKHVPGEGYILRDSDDKESLLFGIPEENIGEPISRKEAEQRWLDSTEGKKWLEDQYAKLPKVDDEDDDEDEDEAGYKELSPAEKKDLYAKIRKRAEKMKF